eukprot:SAG31_NODE_3051_length_4742_cov_35.992031_4_plen_160_part_00
MRQLWLDNEVLDENGVRNYMSNAMHTQQGARLRNTTTPKGVAQQDVDVMGSFQFNGFSIGVEGSSMTNRPADAPPLNSFFIYRRNKVHSMGGFSLGADVVITPGVQEVENNQEARQPKMTEILMEGNMVSDSPVPFAKGAGVTELYLRSNSFQLSSLDQ